MEERDFFEEVCLISLYATRAVKFTAVVDSYGRIVVGKFRKRHSFQGSSKAYSTVEQFEPAYSFYKDTVMPLLNNMASHCWVDWSTNKAHFEIVDIKHQENAGGQVLLAATPLTQSKDKYLCIYLQMPRTAPDKHQQIISKLCDAIK
jgi:hypothetical protein